MIPSWVSEYVGIPFKSCGRTHDACDCYGLARLVLSRQFGITLPLLDADYTDALNFPRTHRIFKEQLPLLTVTVAEEDRASGDIVVINSRGWPSHVGVYVADDAVITTEKNIGSYIDRLNGQLLLRIEGFYRVKNSSKG